MFKKPANAKPNADLNPYLNGRREWTERYADHIKGKRAWMLTALGSMAVAAIACGGLGAVAAQQKTVPYIVQVDKLGAVLPVARADQASRPDQRVIRAQLADWITKIRTVSVDASAQMKNVYGAYALIDQNGPAFQVVNDHMKENDPFKRAQKETVDVEVNSVLPVGADTWRVEWTETTRGRDGQVAQSVQWQAVLNTKIVPPASEEAIFVNPLGIFVNAVSWSRRI
ncbi:MULTISPECIES: conjugal transfer protein TrbF [Brevundimonas]|uniref:Bacterial virulence protein VirB8 domain-containing protein n=1 Tax=Brevundimonas nasdae TaxID=172043 RepID=A0A0B4CHC5_9CAUL|nr:MULTISPECIES: conjugal transfer protein TrbF [Brevundimonas]KIC55877.1 hypothetical protein RM53_14235 [Brevundimonas nasdae]RSB43058.1 conjugal transfer protein [Brevundimonas sp. 357]